MKDVDTQAWDKLLEEARAKCSLCSQGVEVQDPLHVGEYFHAFDGHWILCDASDLHLKIFDLLDVAGML